VFLTTTDAGLVERAAGEDALWLTVHAGEVRPRAAPPE
jgi:hypothetical protein